MHTARTQEHVERGREGLRRLTLASTAMFIAEGRESLLSAETSILGGALESEVSSGSGKLGLTPRRAGQALTMSTRRGVDAQWEGS